MRPSDLQTDGSRLGRFGQAITLVIVSAAALSLIVVQSRVPPGLRSASNQNPDDVLESPGLFFPQLGPYPGPTYAPTDTPVPAGEYYPIPSGIQYEIVTLQTAPDSDLLTVLQPQLDTHQSSALAARANNPLEVLIGVYCKNGVTPSELEDALDDLFASGSTPLIQGYYRSVDAAGTRALSIIVTGWLGSVAVPQYTPEPLTPWCDTWPTAPSVWVMSKITSASEWRWGGWLPGEYEGLVRQREGMGTYYVIRP